MSPGRPIPSASPGFMQANAIEPEVYRVMIHPEPESDNLR